MHYDSVLAYVRKVLSNYHIPTVLYEEPFNQFPLIDLGLRESLFDDFNEREALDTFRQNCAANTLYYFTDSYYCSYVAMLLPNPKKLQYLLIGPYTYIDFNKTNYLTLLEKLNIPSALLPLLENYYYNIAFVQSEVQFKNMIGTLADTIWEDSKNYTIAVVHKNPWCRILNDFTSIPEQPYLKSVNIQVAEARYAFENQCMQAVSQGNLALIDQLVSGENGIRMIPRLADSLRDYKNYMVIFNTLLRKAAEQGAVHPIYLDQLSSKFAKKIEALTSVTDHSLEREMLHKYCILVRNYSVKGYSPIIQKVVNQINLNLTSDLSLRTLAEMFHISAGYLSTLFHKELGITLTDYVNKKRIEHAILLLNATDLQIQTVAACCGIQDINYFTRIFKKFKGMTPKKYRELITQTR
ncbi:MAG: helix-turn-helix domain-containing protein [Lachnospiraceae bacterium]|nr:helix-turn-helix domain-containing protein [Lachnospiraceae bacterium]